MIIRNIKLFTFLIPLLGISILLFGGCSDEFIPLDTGRNSAPFQITATIPHHQQLNVPLSSGVIVHFSSKLNPITVNNRVEVTDEKGNQAPITLEAYGASIIIMPNGLWDPRTTYFVTIMSGITSSDNKEEWKTERVINFTTGVRRPKQNERLSVISTVPAENEPCWDFHTFRVFFNEPVLRTTIEYGKTFSFIDAQTNEPVPGNLFGRGNQLVFDPDDDLTPGKVYRLVVATGLTDYSGDSLQEEFTAEFTPRSTGNRAVIAMDKCPTVVEDVSFCDAMPEGSLLPKSKFIDRDLNSMFADSVLLGPTNFLVGARLWNEFAEPKVSTDRIPFVVRKGQKLFGKGLKGYVGGVIPSGTDTGIIEVTVMTDTIGELMGSQYVHGIPGLPATVRLSMDASISSEDPGSAAVLGQPIIGVTLTGQASVTDIDQIDNYRTMVIEIVGFAEVELLNEYVPVTMALQMVPPPTMPERIFDTTPPQVRSISPVDFTLSTEEDISEDVTTRWAGDDIVVTFSEPMDPDNVEGALYLQKPDGSIVSGEIEIYNPKIVFIPDSPLDPNTLYTVFISDELKDLSGNNLAEPKQASFRTMPSQSSDIDPPLLCATVPGAFPGASLPSNFYVEIYFSQVMDLDSLVYGDPGNANLNEQGVFAVFDVTGAKTIVPGTFIYNSLFIRFVPDERFVPGHSYILEITSEMTNIHGLELDTDQDRVPGGPSMEIPFTATPVTNHTQTMLATYPYGDADVNGYIDGEEYEINTNYMAMDFPLVHNRSYSMGFFPITIQPLVYDTQGNPRIPISIQETAVLYASNVKMALSGPNKADPPGLLDMGRIHIDVLDDSSTDLYLADDGLIGVDADTKLYFAVENELINNFLIHESFFKIPSILRISNDGRMVVLIDGATTIQMDIPILGIQEIPVQTKMTTSTLPPRRGF